MPLDVSFLFGGISTEYDGSITSLTNIISTYLALPDSERPFSVRNLYHLSRQDGLVHIIPFRSSLTIAELEACISDSGTVSGRSLLNTFDTIKTGGEYLVNLLHGQFGEDGGVQSLAALSGLRGTFGDPYAASLTMNKFAMSSFVSSLLHSEAIRVPKTVLITPRNVAASMQIARSFECPIVLKPNSLGSSLYAQLFHDPKGSQLEIEGLIRTIFRYDTAVLIQEFIPGDEYTCGCMVGSSELVTLPAVKLEADAQFCSREQKYSSRIARKTIVREDSTISTRLNSLATTIASSINLFNMARFDFRVCRDSHIYFLECNYIPGLAKNSSFEKMIQHRGMSVIDLIVWIMNNSTSFKKPDYCINYACVNGA